ncbi:MAG TPA: toxic anion resistance protein [Candidatus Ventricola intestinavium]|nr:toxic anion resistance protein [Candidatus Ventricola intestinavium]
MDNKTIPTLILPGEENTQEDAAPAQAEPAAQAAPAAQTAPAASAVQAAPASQAAAEPVAAEEDSLNFDNLSAEEQAAVLAFVDRIDISNSETVLKYGNAAQVKISQFSDKILTDVKTKDTGAISDMLANLVAELKGFDVDEGKKNGFFGLFKKAGNSITQLKARFDKVEENVAEIVASLQGHQKQLISDCKMLDGLYAQNEQYYHELTLYIIAGEIKLRRLREQDLPPLLAKAQETADPADAQAANDFSQLIERFEKRIHDLKLTRMVSVQMGPQIRLMQNNDNLLAERIQSTVVNTVPLWKSQMVIALGMQHAESALSAQKAVTDMTNELLRSNAQRLKMGTIETAREAERGVVDLETIRVANTALIDTLTEVQKIQREGAQKRAAAAIELGRLEKELRDKVLEIHNP